MTNKDLTYDQIETLPDPDYGKMRSCREALVAAFNAVPESDVKTRATLHAILIQQGCEEHDPGVRDGMLTTLMDLVIFG